MADVPRVFCTYSHDSAEHADRVLALADALCDGGIEVILDRYVHPAPEEGWPRWMERNLDEADFILMICTDTYRRCVMGQEEPGQGLGVRWEGSLIYNRIYHDRSSGSRFIPVLLPGSEPAHIPNPVQGHAYYRIATFDLTDSGFEALYRHLTNQPATPRPDRGPITILPPRPRPRPGAEEARLVCILDGLKQSKDPEMVPVLFQCLANPSDEVRRKAKAALDAFGWEAVIAAIEGLARRGDGESVGHILDGLDAFEAHPGVVRVLARMVSLLQGAHRARAILLWERKRLGLMREEIAGQFRKRQSDYRIEKVLGQGLFTSVFLASYEGRALDVVIRILRPEFVGQPRIVAQFLDLSRKCLRFKHQNLVQTRDVSWFPEHDLCFAVREYVDGATFQKVLETGRTFGPSQVIAILHSVLEGLGPLHRAGMSHNGIKPSNIFLCEGDRVVLGDPSLPVRGIGVDLDRLVYDYRYASPEMILGKGEPRSDFYALGCVAYELLCGEPPFVADHHQKLATQHERDPIVLPSARGCMLGEAGDEFLRRLLAKSPSDRPATLDEVSRQLDALLASLRLQVISGRTSTPLTPNWLARIESAQSVLSFEPSTDLPFLSANRGRKEPLDRENPAVPHLKTEDPPSTGAPPDDTGTFEPSTGAPPDDTGTFSECWSDDSLHPPFAGPGQVLFGRYLVLKQLGEGGMGSVWLVSHLDLDAKRAIKLIHPKLISSRTALGTDARARFQREARVMARLSHPNAVIVHDARIGRNAAFIEMEYILGQSLKQLLQPGVPMPLDWTARILEQLCDVLQVAHDLDIVHRDLKPPNLMLVEGRPPGKEQLKVLDFGIAKILGGDPALNDFWANPGAFMGSAPGSSPEQADATNPGAFIGSAPWSSPEQVCAAPIDTRSDLYAVGVILYELLTGYRPFSGSFALLLYDHVNTPPPAFAKRNPNVVVPSMVERVVMRCLAKNPDDRPQTARELYEEFAAALPQGPMVSPTEPAEISGQQASMAGLTRWIGRMFGK